MWVIFYLILCGVDGGGSCLPGDEIRRVHLGVHSDQTECLSAAERMKHHLDVLLVGKQQGILVCLAQ